MKETKRDHGYAWVVLVASFIHNMLCASVMMSIAVYMVDWVELFQTTKAEIGFAGSMFAAISCLTGLFIGPLNDRLGCRLVSIIGSCIVVIGLILTSFATSVMWIYVSYSIITGFGLGMSFLAPMIIVQFYFNKRRALASGISLSGHSMGTFTLMPLLRFLVQTYGWKGAMLIQAGLVANMVVTGSLYRAPVLPELTKKKEAISKENHDDGGKITKFGHAVLHFFKTNWDFKLFKKPVFALFIAGLLFCQLSGELMYKFTPLKAVSIGIDKVKSSIFPSVIGFTSTGGRIITSIVVNLKCVNRTFLFGSAILVSGVATIATSFTDEFISLAVGCGVYGVALGTFMTLLTTVLVDLIGLASLVQGQSFMIGGVGISVTVALTFAGFITDKTKNYNMPYYIYGSFTVFGGILVLIIVFLQQRYKKEESVAARENINNQEIENQNKPYPDSSDNENNKHLGIPNKEQLVYASMQSLSSIT